MYVALLWHTPNPEKAIASAAKLCYYEQADIVSLIQGFNDKDAEKYIRMLLDAGHLSPFEHASFTFGVEGVSRSLLAQVTRHRIASFSVRSQRYCSEEQFSYILPPSIKDKPFCERQYKQFMESVSFMYKALLVNGIPKEDARMVLPNACCTRFEVTMNVRELYHFFNLRCCSRAQWEIRELANAMLKGCKLVSPVLFEHAGASCVSKGYCTEGKKSCGKAPTLQEILAERNDKK